jgi:hypothetical protein
MLTRSTVTEPPETTSNPDLVSAGHQGRMVCVGLLSNRRINSIRANLGEFDSIELLKSSIRNSIRSFLKIRSNIRSLIRIFHVIIIYKESLYNLKYKEVNKIYYS